jgi:hypothetical protein
MSSALSKKVPEPIYIKYNPNNKYLYIIYCVYDADYSQDRSISDVFSGARAARTDIVKKSYMCSIKNTRNNLNEVSFIGLTMENNDYKLVNPFELVINHKNNYIYILEPTMNYVKVFDNNVSRLQRLQNNLGQRVWTSVLEPKILAKQLKTCEVAVGALRNDFGRAPIVVTEEMVAAMRPGSIIIDVAIDRGGCFETSELTNHENPIIIKHNVLHYGVPNIPSGFARTASQAISNVLMPLLVQVGDQGGLAEIIWQQAHLREGIYLYKGALTDLYISAKFDLKFTDLNLIIASRS